VPHATMNSIQAKAMAQRGIMAALLPVENVPYASPSLGAKLSRIAAYYTALSISLFCWLECTF